MFQIVVEQTTGNIMAAGYCDMQGQVQAGQFAVQLDGDMPDGLLTDWMYDVATQQLVRRTESIDPPHKRFAQQRKDGFRNGYKACRNDKERLDFLARYIGLGD